MTQSPYGETASPKFAQGAGSDFGATTISGTPASTTATEQRSGSGATTRPEDTNYRQAAAQPGTRTASAAGATAARPARARGPRRARLQLRHISPLTALKFPCV